MRPSDLQADEGAFAALENISDYAPANKAYAVAKIQTLKDAMDAADNAKTQAAAAAKAARDDAHRRRVGFPQCLIAAKQQVIAQYGDDSNQAQAVGLTKKSERAKPSRPSKAAGDAKK